MAHSTHCICNYCWPIERREPRGLPELVDDHSERLGHLSYTREVGKPFSECQACHATVRFRGEGL